MHNDFGYPSPACGHLVKLARKGFVELQGSVILQPQQVTAFPAEYMFVIVQFGLRPDASKHHIRVCASLTAQFVFFILTDSGVLLSGINVQTSASTFVLHHSEWLLLLLVELDIPTSVSRSQMDGPLLTSRRRLCSAYCWCVHYSHNGLGFMEVSRPALLYIDVSVRPSSEPLFFFGHLLSRFNHLEAPVLGQATPPVVSSPIDLSYALEALLELDD